MSRRLPFGLLVELRTWDIIHLPDSLSGEIARTLAHLNSKRDKLSLKVWEIVPYSPSYPPEHAIWPLLMDEIERFTAFCMLKFCLSCRNGLDTYFMEEVSWRMGRMKAVLPWTRGEASFCMDQGVATPSMDRGLVIACMDDLSRKYVNWWNNSDISGSAESYVLIYNRPLKINCWFIIALV